MDILIVSAHPAPGSLTGQLAAHLRDRLAAQGHAVRHCDLYAAGYDPVLRFGDESGDEGGDSAGLAGLAALVLVCPTWWAGMPAILKGWIDRSFAPGVAYDPTPDGRAMIPRLTALREVLVVTTLGSPWWVDWLVLWRPMARNLRWNLIRPCAPQARVRVLSLYRTAAVDAARLRRFKARIDRAITGYAP